MKRTILTVFACCSLIVFTGCMFCSPVPKNSINIVHPAGRYQIETPKNVSISGFKATVEPTGVLTIVFDRWDATNDSMVIDKAGAARVMEIQAWSELVNAAVATGVKAAKTP